MRRYFSYINSLGQLVIIRQNTEFIKQNGKQLAICSLFIKNKENKVTQSNVQLEQKEIECHKEITLDEVYHVVANAEMVAAR